MTEPFSLREPWNPGQATERIRAKARKDEFAISLTDHAKDQMAERGLYTGDVLYVLKNGFVYEKAEESTRSGFYKYKMVSTTPNSERREVAVIVIPSPQSCMAKIVTVMWVDEIKHSGR